MSDNLNPDSQELNNKPSFRDDLDSATSLADFTDELLSGEETEKLPLAPEDSELRRLQETVIQMRRTFGNGRPDPAMSKRIQGKLSAEWGKTHPSGLALFWQRWREWLFPPKKGWQSSRDRRRTFALRLALGAIVPLILAVILFQYGGEGLMGTLVKPPDGYPGPTGALILNTFMNNEPGITLRVSLSESGEEGNHNSWASSVSANGRVITFVSLADNLLEGDLGSSSDIFVYDQDERQMVRVSSGLDNQPANGDSYHPVISADGRVIAFTSLADNLVVGEGNGFTNIYIYDRTTAALEKVTVGLGGQNANGNSRKPALSADGRFVAFHSNADNLVANDQNNSSDVFIHDRQTGTTTRVSAHSNGQEGNGDSQNAALSADGRFVAFSSMADNLVDGDSNGVEDIFLHDRDPGVTERVSVNEAQEQANHHSYAPALSGDGRYVAFQSDASNLTPDDTNNAADVFVRDRQVGSVELVSVNSAGQQGNKSSGYPAVSADGRFVVFASFADNLAHGTLYSHLGVFVHDRQTKSTGRVAVSLGGTEANGPSVNPAISADGRFVTFDSVASNLVQNDHNNRVDVFIYDRSPNTHIELDHALGQPGSEFLLLGSHFPPNAAASLTVNGRHLGETMTDRDGNLSLILTTDAADPGAYFIKVSVNYTEAITFFMLKVGSGLYALEDDSNPTFAIPSGVALNHFVYLPLLQR